MPVDMIQIFNWLPASGLQCPAARQLSRTAHKRNRIWGLPQPHGPWFNSRVASESPASTRQAARARTEPPDISEKGGLKDGQPQSSDERLFMQLLAFGDCGDSRAVATHLAGAADAVVVYEDLNDPRGIAVLTVSQDPNVFISQVRPRLTS